MNNGILLHAKGDVVNTLHGFHGMNVIAVGDNGLACQLGKLAERILHILQILEVVQMVRLHIQHHRDGGEEIQEGIAILAAFQQDGIALSHPMACAQQRQIAADHNGGIRLGLHQHMGHHGSGSGLAVGAGDADGVLVCLHDLTPGLSPLKDGPSSRATSPR